MGAWDELDTEIHVEADTLEIENDIFNISSLDDFDIFEPAVEFLEKFKEAVEEGSKNGAYYIANMLRSFQEQAINNTGEHPYSQGVLGSNIDIDEMDDYTFIVGTTISHFYPLCVEYGRDEVEAVNAKSLVFYGTGGELVFRKSVGPAPPRPFVEPAFNQTVDDAKDVVLREINHLL